MLQFLLRHDRQHGIQKLQSNRHLLVNKLSQIRGSPVSLPGMAENPQELESGPGDQGPVDPGQILSQLGKNPLCQGEIMGLLADIQQERDYLGSWGEPGLAEIDEELGDLRRLPPLREELHSGGVVLHTLGHKCATWWWRRW